jgi:hypothetical protein
MFTLTMTSNIGGLEFVCVCVCVCACAAQLVMQKKKESNWWDMAVRTTDYDSFVTLSRVCTCVSYSALNKAEPTLYVHLWLEYVGQ